MGQRATEHRARGRRSRIRPGRRPKAILCRPGPDEITDTCLLMLSREVDIEQVPTLTEALRRCLKGKIDILFVNMFSSSSRELTALSAFRTLAKSLWVVALAPEEMRFSLISTGIVDEVLTAAAPVVRPQPRV